MLMNDIWRMENFVREKWEWWFEMGCMIRIRENSDSNQKGTFVWFKLGFIWFES